MSRNKIAGLLALVLALGAFSFAAAQDTTLDESVYDTHGLLIYNVWVRPTAGELAEGATPEPPLPGTTTGAYMTITNLSSYDYQLVAISTDAAEMTHVHETTMEGDVGRMRMIRAVDIPAGETVTLAPLGFHAMLMNATRDIYPGEAVALTLTFADTDDATFDVPIAALATDFPPEEAVAAANLYAKVEADGSLDAVMFFNVSADLPDPIIAVTSSVGGTAELLPPDPLPELGAAMPTAVRLPILVSDFAQDADTPLPSAFTLTLEFESGKTLTVAVPIIGAAS